MPMTPPSPPSALPTPSTATDLIISVMPAAATATRALVRLKVREPLSQVSRLLLVLAAFAYLPHTASFTHHPSARQGGVRALPAPPLALTAGAQFVLNLASYDAYGNLRQYASLLDEDFYAATLTSTTTGAVLTATRTSLNNGNYELSFLPRLALTYTLAIKDAGGFSAPLYGAATTYAVAVAAAAPAASNSTLVLPLPASCTAGAPCAFFVNSTDAFGNGATGGSTYSVLATLTAAAAGAGTSGASLIGSAGVAPGKSLYRATFTPTVAGNYTVCLIGTRGYRIVWSRIFKHVCAQPAPSNICCLPSTLASLPPPPPFAKMNAWAPQVTVQEVRATNYATRTSTASPLIGGRSFTVTVVPGAVSAQGSLAFGDGAHTRPFEALPPRPKLCLRKSVS